MGAKPLSAPLSPPLRWSGEDGGGATALVIHVSCRSYDLRT